MCIATDSIASIPASSSYHAKTTTASCEPASSPLKRSSRRLSGAFDLERLSAVQHSGELGTLLYRTGTQADNGVCLKLYAPGAQVNLSDVLPVLENMGLRVLGVKSYRITPKPGHSVWIHEFSLVHGNGPVVDPRQHGELFQEAFARVWRGEAENDGFNRLVLGAQLDWRDTVVLRACCRYLRQIGSCFSQEYIAHSLADNSAATRLLVQLFHARFNPATPDTAPRRASDLLGAIDTQLEAIENLDQDRILRRFVDVNLVTVRTNLFQPASDGTSKPYLPL